MRLQRTLGLRFKEAACLRPHENDQGDRLEVVHGTKGGRRRFVPIASEAQRALLEAVKARIPKGLSMTAPNLSFEAWRTRADAIFRALGLTKAERRNPHAQRHAYAQGRYRELTDHEAPCRGGKAPREADQRAREVIARELGHGRTDVTSNYLGSPASPDEAA
jgi:integrase